MRLLAGIVSTFCSIATLLEAETAGKAQYVGGTVGGFRPGVEGDFSTGTPSLLFITRSARIEVPYDRVNLVEYGQTASRRIVLAAVVSPMFLLTKSRRHFVTVGFLDDLGKQQAVVLRIGKGQVRPLLASLEARTGVRVQYQDDEARKGKG
jgi:hypothetical protein